MLYRIMFLSVGLLSACAHIQPGSKEVIHPIPTLVVAPPIVVPPPPPVVPPPIVKTPTPPNIGKPIASVINLVGEPSGIVNPKPGIRYFQFSVHPTKLNCVASYLATNDNNKAIWIIKEYIAPDPKIC